MDDRLHAITDLMVSEAREYSGLHDYDGQIQDLSPAGVRSGLARLGGPPYADAHDEAHIAAFEEGLRATFGELETHRWNPLPHLDNLDLAVYDRDYAPEAERAGARRRHLAMWPDAVDGAIASLDRVPGLIAESLLGAARGLADGVDDAGALAAHARLVEHLTSAAAAGPPDVALGGAALTRLLTSWEAMPVDLGRLASRADAERTRLRTLLDDSCARIDRDTSPAATVEALLHDHADADGVLEEARQQVDEVIAFTRAHNLVPDLDGVCTVGPAPPSRRWAMAMISPAAPWEPDAASCYYVTPPDPSWPPDQQEEWLEVFSRTTLPVITAHEVAPGHFAHGRMLRRVQGDIRKTLHSSAFLEGWAHYTEELCLEEGFRSEDPRFAVGVAIEGLVRVTRLAVSIGLHTGAMSLDDAAERFASDAFLEGPAARAEAARATFDPTYGRYTWGKLEILALRDEAINAWGKKYSHSRFHTALLDLGSPPLGLIGAAVGR